jgi:hypothetical protein
LPSIRSHHRIEGPVPRSLSTVLHDVISALRDLLHPAIRPEWNRDPAAIVIQATSAWPQSAQAVALNALPDALIWGDGRIVWTEARTNGSRQVSVGRLETRELAQLLERATRAGFFRMHSWYPSVATGAAGLRDDGIADHEGPYDRSLCVHLLHTSHEVCACDGAAPGAFDDLYRHIATGAGAAGLPYRPAEAFLVATPARRSPDRRLPWWDAGATGLRLEDAAGGVWVCDTALDLAWKLVNATPTDPRVTQGSRAYVLTLQVPDIITWEPRLP